MGSGRTKTYQFSQDTGDIEVCAESEGNARYMVRMRHSRITGRIRIGYLTGTGKNWLAECFGGGSIPARSAKAACHELMRRALLQPGVIAVLK